MIVDEKLERKVFWKAFRSLLLTVYVYKWSFDVIPCHYWEWKKMRKPKIQIQQIPTEVRNNPEAKWGLPPPFALLHHTFAKLFQFARAFWAIIRFPRPLSEILKNYLIMFFNELRTFFSIENLRKTVAFSYAIICFLFSLVQL